MQFYLHKAVYFVGVTYIYIHDGATGRWQQTSLNACNSTTKSTNLCNVILKQETFYSKA